MSAISQEYFEVLASQPVLEGILQFLLYPGSLMSTCKTLNRMGRRFLTTESVEFLFIRVLQSATFSLTSSPEACLRSRRIVLYALFKHGLEYHLVSPELQRDIVVAKTALAAVSRLQPERLVEFSLNIPRDIFFQEERDTFLQKLSDARQSEGLLQKNFLVDGDWEEKAFVYLHIIFPNDLDIFRAAIVQTQGAILEMAPQFQDNDEIVRLAVQQNGGSILYASSRLRRAPSVIASSVKGICSPPPPPQSF